MAKYTNSTIIVEIIVECPECGFHQDVSGQCYNVYDKTFSDEDVSVDCCECGESFIVHSIV